ncbi:bifunctional lytic transglycosylase/C40 family peptidase [Bacillus stratosphericus]|uniref:bifunctional lytic transglycosylase/C40 family peptidase n=1 Tax=Bacillus stratosphericus TaxID=293386 RepID=UPI001CF9FE20|nr:bifunctional lytic transglycosylase/C40 family peptidase [Bacillus stratosphericus]
MSGVVETKIAVTVAKEGYKQRKNVIIAIIVFLMLIFLGAIAAFIGGNEAQNQNSGTAQVNAKVEAWRPVVTEYAAKYKIPDYVDVILAIMMVESGGSSADIMQSSESLGLPPNSISDPNVSIDVGVQYFSNLVRDSQKKKLDYWTPVQSYNFGGGFNNYVKSYGRKYEFELAQSFAKGKAGGSRVKYSNPVADFNGNFRYKYGNMYYVLLVQQYLNAPSGDMGNADASPLGKKKYTKLMNEVSKYKGWGYTWGGDSPIRGFDCSGLTQYNYRKIGFNLPRTAAEQYNTSIKIADPKPGDLVFFKGTNSSRPASSITHVGIYVDKKRMYDANNSGIGYSNWNQGYWKKHLAGFGRVIK